MTTVTITNHAAGKAPVLIDNLPQGITQFLKQAKAFFLIKGHKDDETKILILGSGLGNFPELENWYTTTEEDWEGKPYADFVTALQQRALPRDYVWEARRKVRKTKQGLTDFEDWIDDMRSLQLQLTTCVLPDREFVKHLLYNMDPELCSLLQRGTLLQYSGFHKDDLSQLAFVSTKPTTVSNPIDFEDNLEQIRSLAKKTNSISILNKILTSTSSRSNSPATTSTTTVRTGSAPTNRLAKLTDLEKDWFTAVGGCFKCREWNLPAVVSDDLVKELGTWSSRESTFLVAPLSPPFNIILGVPFMRQEEMSLAVSPDMQVIVPNPAGGESLDLLAPSFGPLTRLDTLACMDDDSKRFFIASLIAESKEALETDAAEEEELERLSKEMMVEFADVFPDGLPKLTDDYLAKTKTRHRIKLIDPNKIQNQKMFSSPRKWQEAWKKDLERALDNGQLRPSTSPYASVCFVIPKKNGKLRWVNNYRILNANTVKDCTPVPDVDQILYAAADAQFWASIDYSDAFWQTPMHEDDIEKTAIKTPWGLFEWTVMPQGLCNAPATHQARINEALQHLIGVCCAAFVDDIIIFSKTLEEHKRNVSKVLKALRKAGFYGSPNKTKLFTTRTKFLGHGISQKGISVDDSKVQKIKEWERPKTVKQVRGFLGMVQYLRKFIPQLAEFTSALTPLTRKGMTRIDHLWTEEQEKAFVGIKKMITSLPVLKSVRHNSDEPIWLMTDASKFGIGAVLLQGEDWKTAHPCGFLSRQYIAAEKSYPTHKQELLAVVGAMKAWRIKLLGCRFRGSCILFQFHRDRSPTSRWILSVLYRNPKGKDMLLTMTDCLTGYTRLLPCRARDGAKEIAKVVFRGWFCLFGVPERLVSDRDKLFTSKLWSRLHKRMGIKLQMSMSFHPETDGRSERSNKKAVQILRAAPFEVVLGFLPSIHSLPTTDSSAMPAVEEIVDACQAKVEEVGDQLAAAKVQQAAQANRPKLFPRWDGPYEVLKVFGTTSTFKLKLPENDCAHPGFHASKLKLYCPNDANQFPDRTPARPEPIDVNGEQEFVVEAILDERKRRNVKEYLVKWEKGGKGD
ncbi:hypothetical protein JCM3766R1_000089 [Sporobolomyces carnicolor]